MLNQMSQLVNDWTSCQRCPLGKDARNHVLWEQIRVYQGIIEAYPLDTEVAQTDAVIVGEGPGIGEDVIGRPFIGPSGSLLRKCLVEALSSHRAVAITLTNLVACRPWALSPTSAHNREPGEAEVIACMPRLARLLRIQRPRLVIAAGDVPAAYMLDVFRLAQVPVKYHRVRHPAWVIRQADKQLAVAVYTQHLKEVFNVLESDEDSSA